MWSQAIVGLLALAVQEPQVELITEQLDGGEKLEFEVRLDADGSQVRHGSFTKYDADGKKRVLGKYEDGQKSGRWNYRYEDGKPWVTGAYQLGQRQGKWTFRHPNREVRATGSYSEGVPSGEWSFTSDGGTLEPHHSGTYEPIVAYHLGNQVEYKGATLDGALHGRWSFFWENGERQLEAEFDRGRRVGDWRFWLSDGTYDPEMVSRSYGGGIDFVELYREPIPVADARREVFIRDAASRSSKPRPEPGRMQPVDSGPADSTVNRLLAGYATKDDLGRESARSKLLLEGRGALPGLLELLRGLDYEDPGDLAIAQELQLDVVKPIFGGHSLLGAEEPPNAELVRLCALRAHSLYVLTGKSADWWEVDLPAVEHYQEADGCELLLDPPIHVEVLYGAGASRDRYALRFDPKRESKLRAAGGSGTAEALRKSLAWLASVQEADGRWASKDGLDDIGVTGLALLALLGDGSTLLVGPYQENVRRAVRWLFDKQETESGRFRDLVNVLHPETGKPARTYSYFHQYGHAIATQAMCELASLTNSRAVRGSARRGIAYIVKSRNPYGVWRYESPPVGDNDTSVTGWMVAAHVAAERAGLPTDDAVRVVALTWFDEVTDLQSGRVGYSAIGELSERFAGVNDQYPREATEAMTGIGLWCRFLLGQSPAEQPIMQKHGDLMLRNLPVWDDDEGLTNDLYYWYFASYAMRRLGGKHWKAWNKSLKQALLDSQVVEGPDAGSWVPNGPWGTLAGRSYATAMGALCLEVYFRYGGEK